MHFLPDHLFDYGRKAWRESPKKRRDALKRAILTKKSKIFIKAKLTKVILYQVRFYHNFHSQKDRVGSEVAVHWICYDFAFVFISTQLLRVTEYLGMLLTLSLNCYPKRELYEFSRSISFGWILLDRNCVITQILRNEVEVFKSILDIKLLFWIFLVFSGGN